MRSLRPSLPLVVVISAACGFADEVPKQARILCDTNRDCPSGFICRENIRQCLPAENLDETPPAIVGEPELSRDVATTGSVVTVSFDASEPLAEDPTVFLNTEARSVPFVIDEGNSSREKLHYVFRLAIVGSEAEGLATVVVDLVDASGLAARGQVAGSVRLDFTTPTLVGIPALSSAFLRADAITTLDIAMSEPTVAPPTVTLVPKVGGTPLPFSLQDAVSDVEFRYQFTASQDFAQGSYDIEVVAEDEAHIVSPPLVAGAVDLDFDPPTLVSTVLDPPVSRPGDVVRLTVRLSELPGAVPDAVASSGDAQIPFDLVAASGDLLTYHHVVAEGEDGVYTVQLVDAVDRAGNPLPDPSLGTVAYDGTAPSIADIVINDEVLNAAETLRVRFSTSEPLAFDPVVSLGGLPLALEDFDGAIYTFSLPIAASGLLGSFGVRVELADEAGNHRVEFPASVQVDSLPPAVVVGSESVIIAPPATSLVNSVTRATVGAQVRVGFVVDEPLAQEPEVRTSSPEVLPLSLLQVAGTAYVFTLAVPPSAGADGEYPLRATLTDLSGNTSDVALQPTQPLVVDTTPPAPLDSPARDKMVYRRAPWGTATSNVASFSVTSDGPAVEPGSTVIVWDAEDINTASELGRGVANPDGSLPDIRLTRSDRSQVFVSQVDAAGNVDAPVAARAGTVDWLATLGGKVAGSDFENPHESDSRRFFNRTLTQGSAVALDAQRGIARADGVAPETSSAGTWQEHRAGAPERSWSEQLAFDAGRGRAVLFAADGTTWEWDGVRWHEVIPTDPEGDGNPTGRQYGAMVYVPERGTVVMFGGTIDGFLNTNQMWSWDGTSWKDITPPDDVGMGGRAFAPAAWDSARGRLVSFGGFDQDYGSPDTTWEWDGSSWSQVFDADADGDGAPYAREYHAMAYDAARGQVVLYGGYEDGAYAGETWTWDGTNWTLHYAPDGGDGSPRGYYESFMSDDPLRQRVVFFGGGGDDGNDGNTWEWDGAQWHLVAVADGSGPLPRTLHSMAFDPTSGRTLLFSGATAFDLEHDLWSWDGLRWRLAGPFADAPSARFAPGAAFDSTRGKAVLFGGSAAEGLSDETWEWDGAAWALKTPTDDEADGNPVARNSAYVTFDPLRGQTLLFGGSTDGGLAGDTWTWDGSAWRAFTGEGPGPRTDGAMAFDAARGTAVMFGGADETVALDETWTFDGTAWSNLTPVDRVPGDAPAPRYGTAMAYDPLRQNVVLFSGETDLGSVDDTWLWDGSTWTQVTPEDPEGDGNPPARLYHSMAFDPIRAAVVLFAGFAGVESADVWEWNGTSWAQRDLTDPENDGVPSTRYLHVSVFDEVNGKMLTFGGYGADYIGETWSWDGGAASTPAQTFSFLFRAAGAPEGAQLVSLSARVDAAGHSAGADGARLQAWDRGGWVTKAQTSGAGVQSMSITTDDPAEIERLLLGDERALHLAVTPATASGVSTSTVSGDYAELRVRYLLP